MTTTTHARVVAVEMTEAEPWGGGFWNHRWVQNVLPFCTSMWLHAAIIVIGVLTIPPIIDTLGRTTVVIQTVPAVTDLLHGGGGGLNAPGHIGPGDDPTTIAQQMREFTDAEESGLHNHPGPNLVLHSAIGEDTSASESLISLGTVATIMRTGRPGGPGILNEESGGPLARFGPSNGGDWRCAFFESGPPGRGGARAQMVIFACDASGSMLGQQFDLLKREIRKAVDGLKPAQGFDVVFFRDEGCAALSEAVKSTTLLMGTAQSKARTQDFLNDMETRGQTNPLPALKHAMRLKPDLIYLLTDGVFDNPDIKTVLAEVRRLNPGKTVRINTIAFYRVDVPASEQKLCDEVLKTIARENGGTFQAVTTTDLTAGR